MSRIATKPSLFATWSPSSTSWQNRQSSGSDDPLLGDLDATDADEPADGRVDEPWRVVVPVAASGAIDEDDVICADLLTPASEARRFRRGPQPGTPILLHREWNGVVSGRDGSGSRRVREDVDFCDAGRLDDVERVPESTLGFRRKADDRVGRQVEVRERLEAAQVRLRRIAPRHVPEHAVVARLQRHVQMRADRRRFVQRRNESVIDVVDLDRGQAQALEAVDLPHLPDEPRQWVAGVAVAVAAEVDPGQDDLAVALSDPPAHLVEHSRGSAAA